MDGREELGDERTAWAWFERVVVTVARQLTVVPKTYEEVREGGVVRVLYEVE